MTSRSRYGGRFRGVVFRLLASFALAIVFLGALVCGAVLHMNIPATRQTLLTTVNDVLDRAVAGRIVIDDLDAFGFGTVHGATIRIIHPSGRRVILGEKVNARIDLGALVASAGTSGPLVVRLLDASVGHAEIVLDRAPNGELLLAQTFAPRTTPRPEPSRRPEERPGRGVDFSIVRADIAEADAHAALDGRRLHGTLRFVHGDMSLREGRTRVNVGSAIARVHDVLRDADATAELSGSMRAEEKRPLAASVALRGSIGQVPVSARVTLHDGKISAAVRVPRTPPESVRALFPSAPLHEPIAADVSLDGNEKKVDYRLRAELGASTLAASGAARLASRTMDAEFSLRDFDPKSVSPDAPSTRLNAKGRTDVDLSKSGAPAGTARVAIEPFNVDGFDIPRSDVEARLYAGRIDGHAALYEPGARTDVSFRIRGSPSLSSFDTVEFHADTNVPKLDGVERLGPIAAGAATIVASGVIGVREGEVDARLDARLLDVSRAGFRAGSASVQGRAVGSLDDPRIEAKVFATDVRARDFRFETLDGAAMGPLSALDVRGTAKGPDQTIQLSTHLDLRDGVRMTRTRADVTRRNVQAQVEADAIAVKRGTFSFQGVRVEGPGSLQVDGTFSARQKHISIQGDRIDLEALGEAFGAPQELEGQITLDTDLRRTDRGWTGYVRANVSDFRLGSARGLTGRLSARVQNDRVDGRMDVEGEANSTARVSVRDFHLPQTWSVGALLDEAVGQIDVEAHGDVAMLQSASPVLDRLIALEGRVVLLARARRESPRGIFDLDFYVVTQDLQARPETAPLTGQDFGLQRTALGAASKKLDFQLRGRVDASRREIRLDARLDDPHGPIAGATFLAALPPSVTTLRSLSNRAALLDSEIDARVTIPERNVEDLPDVIRPPHVSGDVQLAVEAHGKVADPVLYANGTMRGLRVGLVELGTPLEVRFAAMYDDPIGHLRVRATHQGQPVLDAEATVQTSAREWMATGGNARPFWDASARAALHGFPLEAVSWLSDYRMSGLARGSVSLDRLNQNPALNGDLEIDGLRVGAVRYETTRLSLRAKDGHLSANLDCRQVDGQLTARLDSALKWNEPLSPALDANRGVDLTTHAIHFDIGAVQPFVAETFSRIGGKLYADARYSVQNGKATTAGTVFLRDGIVQLPAIGQEFRDVRFDAKLDEDGTLRVRDASARGLSGRATAEAQAKFAGLRLQHANVDVIIHKNDELPITVQGVSLGRAWGRVLIEATSDEPHRRTVVHIDVPRFHLQLPRTIGREIQSLDEAPSIEIGVHKPSGEFEKLALQPVDREKGAGGHPRQLVVEVELGNDVWITRPNLFNVKLDGDPKLVFDDETKMLGQIFLKDGSVDVLGKRFAIVDGTVTFREEQPSNPIVVATARWESPAGYTVFADYTGPVESGNLELRANPSLTESEILGLIVFGSPEGQVAAAGQSGGLASGAAGVGGGVATMGLNRALSRLSEREITTRIDTGSAGGPRPEVAMQVSRRLSVELAYNPAPSLLTREPDHALLTLMFRLKPKWLLETTVGDAGTSVVELIWRHRY